MGQIIKTTFCITSPDLGVVVPWHPIDDLINIGASGIDRQELLSWSIQTLMAAAGQAMQQKNSGAVVSAIRQLDHMTGTGYNSHRVQGVRRRS